MICISVHIPHILFCTNDFLNKLVSELGSSMEGGVSGFPGMIVLNSQNYADWKIKMEDLLIVKDLYEPIDRAEIPKGVLDSV